MRRIQILDTTLRDGEQSPGCSMDLQEKLEMAARLEALRVDIIEAGFAVASPDDFAAVKAIAQRVKTCRVASLARATEKDIDAAWEAVRPAAQPYIHIFLATSPIHMEYKLKITPEETLQKATRAVAYAKTLCPWVQFSAEDATRSQRGFLAKVYEAAIAAGASTISVTDTVGCSSPYEMHELIRFLKDSVPGIEGVNLAVHCHNDLGMASANTLAALSAGANQAECTLNGIGERAGNAALEEVALALYTKQDCYQAKTGLEIKQIYRASRTLSGIIGVSPSPHKPIVGANAFTHEAGVHQHGMMAHRGTYEIMTPEEIGIPSSQMVLGKHSGRPVLEERLQELGFSPNPEELRRVFEQFKLLADRKKLVTDDDLIALMRDKPAEIQNGYEIVRFVVNAGSTIPATAAIKLRRDGQEQEEASTGDGPINAAFNAIDKIVAMEFTLVDYSIRAVTAGEDALGESVVKLRRGNETVTGRGLSTDIIEASIKAYVNGINKLAARP